MPPDVVLLSYIKGRFVYCPNLLGLCNQDGASVFMRFIDALPLLEDGDIKL